MSTPSTGDSPSWHRADFILRGEYCPLDEVRDHLDRLRAALGVTTLVHIATDHELVMRTLSWALGEPDEAARTLSRWIRTASYRTSNEATRDAFVAATEALRDQVVDLDPALPGRLFERLSEVRLDDLGALDPATRAALAGREWGGAVLSHTGKPDVAPWDGEVRSVVLTSPPVSLRNDDVRRLVLDLGVMIKCTAESNARRDSVVMQRVTKRLSVPGAGASLDDVARSALTLACEITGSTGGAVYLRTPSRGPVFRRIAVQTNEPYSLPPELPAGSATTVGWSVERHRAYQRIRGSGAAEALASSVSPEGGAELVTPIAGPSADSSASALGAIVLFRAEGERGYSAYERALVRNVALRLALFRTNIATREIATAISVLRGGSPRRLQAPLPEAEIAAAGPWPKDVVNATARFRDPLGQLAASTHSHSVTLRIALPDSLTDAEHGLVLTRIAAHPPDRLHDPYQREQEGDPGLHWAVMREGREIYLPDVRGDRQFEHFRPDTVSALCVPVRVEGVLVGTLNLESPFADNYAPYLPLIVALSGAVGRTLADARAELEADLLDKTAQGLARRHEYGGDLTEMQQKLLRVEPTDLRDELVAKTEKLQTLIKDLREPDRPENLPALSLWRIVTDTLGRSKLRMSIAEPAEPVFHQPLQPLATRELTTVLENVWRNVLEHSRFDGRDDDGRLMPRAFFELARLDGKNQAMVIVENLSRWILDDRFCASLYRYPAEGQKGDIRLGSYIAGLNARRIGARIHGLPVQDGRILRTILMIPLEELRDITGSD